MSGFKNFLLRGNLVELAVALHHGGRLRGRRHGDFTVIMDVIGYIGGTADFSSYAPGGDLGRRLPERGDLVRRSWPRSSTSSSCCPTPRPRSALPGRGGRHPRRHRVLEEIRDLLRARNGQV